MGWIWFQVVIFLAVFGIGTYETGLYVWAAAIGLIVAWWLSLTVSSMGLILGLLVRGELVDWIVEPLYWPDQQESATKSVEVPDHGPALVDYLPPTSPPSQRE